MADAVVDELAVNGPVGDAEHDHDERPAGRVVDRAALVDLTDAVEVPNVQAVRGDRVAAGVPHRDGTRTARRWWRLR